MAKIEDRDVYDRQLDELKKSGKCVTCFDLACDNPPAIFKNGACWKLGCDAKLHWVSSGAALCKATTL